MKNYIIQFCTALLIVVQLSSCNNDDDSQNPIGENDDMISLQLSNSTEFGEVLVDQKNQSMYFFAADVSGESFCSGGCAEKWPAVLAEMYQLEISSDLELQDFGTISREDGKKQLTFKGWPLYYFSPLSDGVLETPGLTQGDGAGGLFHIAKPDYSVLLARQVVEEGGESITYLVDDRGVSLYFNNGDAENQSNCNGGCPNVWPPFQTPTNLVLPSSINQNDFQSIERADDLGPQISFNNSPLYFFTNDEQKRGVVLGQAGGPNKTFFVSEPTLP